MKVKLAKTAGFCMGVRRAMNIVLDAANKQEGKIYTHGPLVHNPQAIEMLKQKGVDVLGKDAVSDATVIIRAHGITPEERRLIKETGNILCDATCPHVARAQAIIRKEVRKGSKAIIIGDKGHAEVNGLLGFSEGNGFVVENVNDVDGLPEMDKVCIVAQTTQDRNTFDGIVARIKERISDTLIFDTICDSTNMRQKEVSELAKEVDAMVIVGGKNSANTKRLYEISLATGTPSFHIEEENELDQLGLEQYENIGVMAGASTPNWVINKVIDKIKYLLKKKKSRLFRLLESIGEFLVESTLYLSFGAVSMCYASLIFQGIKPTAAILSITFLYVFAVHVFNRHNEKLKDEFFDPTRTRFFEDYGKRLITLATTAALVSLYLSYTLGVIPFVLLAFSYLLGIIYSMRIIPQSIQSFIKYKRLRDVPGSKDIFVSLAWAWVIVLIPSLSHETLFSYKAILMFLFIIFTVFIRSIIFDIVSIEGDRIVGRETIPILLGKKRSQVMLMTLSAIAGIFMFTSALSGLVLTLGFYIILSPFIMVASLYILQVNQFQSGRLFEAIIDSNFILAGFIAYLWQLAVK